MTRVIFLQSLKTPSHYDFLEFQISVLDSCKAFALAITDRQIQFTKFLTSSTNLNVVNFHFHTALLIHVRLLSYPHFS